MWFNPPWSCDVKDDIGRKFLKILDKTFKKPHPLAKIFNRSTVKLSYRTCPNLADIISKHNNKILKSSQREEEPGCNCRSGAICPMDGKCNIRNIIYQATVEESQSQRKETYIGLASTEFKKRLANHKKTCKNKKLAKICKLAQHIWKLKNNKKQFNISWKLVCKSTTFSPVSNVCNLCTIEKYFIVYHPEMATINSRTELINNCRHKSSVLLDKGCIQ